MNTSGYQASDLVDIEFSENDQLDVDAVFRRSIDNPLSPSNLNDSEMRSMAENPILIDEEQLKENCPPLPTTPVSKRSTQPRVLMRRRPFGLGFEKAPDYV